MSSSPAAIPSLADALRLFLRLMRILKPVRGRLLRISSIGLIVTTAALVTPLFSKVLIDNVYPTRDLNLLAGVLLGLAVIQLASAFLGALQSFSSTVVSMQVQVQADLLLFNHLQHLPVQFHDRHRVGEVLSRFGDLRSSIAAGIRLLQSILVRGINYLMVPPILLILHPLLCLVALAPLPITGTISLVSGRFVRKAMKISTERMADASAYRVEVLQRIRTLKSLAVESEVYSNYRDQLVSGREAQIHGRAIAAAAGLANSFIRVVGQALLGWMGWSAVLAGELSLGSFMAFMAYIGFVTRPVTDLLAAAGSFQQLAVSLARTFEYLDMSAEQNPAAAVIPDAARPSVALRGAIEARRLRFGYDADRDVLSGIDLKIEAGERVAIVGGNGAGKSTLLRVLALIDPPSEGTLLFDGRSVRQLPLGDLRRQITFVWQEPALIRGTIRENLMLGVAPCNEDHITEALDVCGLGGFVSALPNGLDTSVAECGATLSGGQRQRIALARARLARRPLLFLDEATSSIAANEELLLLSGLLETNSCTTLLYVTHRIPAAAAADRIICLADGKVVGSGSHRELHEQCPAYYALASTAGAGATGVIPIESRSESGASHERVGAI